jgi:hypothetical protein
VASSYLTLVLARRFRTDGFVDPASPTLAAQARAAARAARSTSGRAEDELYLQVRDTKGRRWPPWMRLKEASDPKVIKGSNGSNNTGRETGPV